MTKVNLCLPTNIKEKEKKGLIRLLVHCLCSLDFVDWLLVLG